MKNIIYILLTVLICSSCYKEPIQEPIFAAEINVVHLSSAVQNIDALLADEQAFVHGLAHYEQSGYHKLPANEWVELLVTQSSQHNILKRESKQFEEDQRYTLLFYSANGGTRSLWLNDMNQASATTAFVRIINMVEDSQGLEKDYTLESSNDALSLTDQPVDDQTGFISTTAEPTIFTITDEANNDIKIETGLVDLKAGKQYTIIVEGNGDQITSFLLEH